MKTVFLSLVILFFSCSSAKNTEAEINNLQNIVLKKNIELEFEWAKPSALLNNIQGIQNLLPIGSTVGNINLIGNANYFRIFKDSLSISLPYFGQQQLPSGYLDRENGITFNGKPNKKEVKFNAKKQRYILSYWAKSAIDTYVFNIEMLPNNRAYLYVNSTNRTDINFDGNWQKLEKIEKE